MEYTAWDSLFRFKMVTATLDLEPDLISMQNKNSRRFT